MPLGVSPSSPENPTAAALRSHYRCPEGELERLTLTGNAGEFADRLRFERYVENAGGRGKLESTLVRSLYYGIRRFLPVPVRKHLQRARLAGWRTIPFPAWPVDFSVDDQFEHSLLEALQRTSEKAIPFVWFWPKGHRACMLMTHDVEQADGRDFCPTLMSLDETAGLRSSFQIVPEQRYSVPSKLLDEIRARGHEVNVHDLNHDGHLFDEFDEFLRRAERIRAHAQNFGAEGFRSGVLYRNLDWFEHLGCSYDMSVPNVAHLDPQRGGCCTVMPYFIGDVLELPLTTTQDYSLFHVLNDYSLKLWEEQMRLIVNHHGLLSFNVHPDYILENNARAVYVALLLRLATLRTEQNVWAALPREVNRWWRLRSQMELACEHGRWRITGEGSEDARVAWAAVDGTRLVYSVES
jgi:hypothetical protein